MLPHQRLVPQHLPRLAVGHFAAVGKDKRAGTVRASEVEIVGDDSLRANGQSASPDLLLTSAVFTDNIPYTIW